MFRLCICVSEEKTEVAPITEYARAALAAHALVGVIFDLWIKASLPFATAALAAKRNNRCGEPSRRGTCSRVGIPYGVRA